MTKEISRIDSNDRLSKVVVCHGQVYLSGLTAKNKGGDIQAQTLDVLSQIDDYLAKAGTNKSKLLRVNIWLDNIDNFAAMNEAWDKWVDKAAPPARATVESRLAGGGVNLVEMMATAII